MVVFTQKVNGVTGCSEWDVQDDNYDYHQEIARSAFADMLHDTERNKKYFLALKAAIDKMHSEGKPAHVLDIGTGTGLLSIMAAQCGADSIVACEAFQPMADCSVKIIEDNGFADKITVIPKRSTELVVGQEGDLPHRANILVTEVFDTELIGEGAIQTFSHAHSVLLEDDCIIVPDSATVYAHVVECPTIQRWNKLLDLADEDGKILIKTPSQLKDCNGSAAVHDLQLSQLHPSTFREVLKPLAVLQYDWSGKVPLMKKNSTTSVEKSLITGKAQMVFMWWDLKMDTEGKILLSCAPWWCHPDANLSHEHPEDTIPWRDHWMQAVYYFPNEIPVKKGDELSLISSQDEFSLWFSLKNGMEITKADSARPICECGVHMIYSRTHVACMNDGTRNKKLLRVLKKLVDSDTVCLCVNGASLMGLAVAKLGARKIIYIESGIIAKRVLQTYITENNLSDTVEILPDMESVLQLHSDDVVSLILGDPIFNSAILPWDNLHLGYVIGKYKSHFTKDVKVLPGACTLWAMSVEFLDLHKIKAPLNICETIDLKRFDNLVKSSRLKSDDDIEPQPLWEYPCFCRSNPVRIIEINLQEPQKDTQISVGSVPSDNESTYNGFAFWLEWDLDDDPKNKISTGPLQAPEINKRISWDPFSRQGVKILEESNVHVPGQFFQYNIKCNLPNGYIDINVSIK